MTSATQLELHLESFDGPLELLLLLIEQRRLPITQVSLAQVADQYMAHVHAQPALDADLLADFLVIGGKLLLLKSRALLRTEEPDLEAEEIATDLADRLATYRVFRAAAEVLREHSRVSFRRLAGQTVDEVIATFLALLELFRRGLIRVEQSAPFEDLTVIAAAPW